MVLREMTQMFFEKANKINLTKEEAIAIVATESFRRNDELNQV